jgi:hypothetical protein
MMPSCSRSSRMIDYLDSGRSCFRAEFRLKQRSLTPRSLQKIFCACIRRRNRILEQAKFGMVSLTPGSPRAGKPKTKAKG